MDGVHFQGVLLAIYKFAAAVTMLCWHYTEFLEPCGRVLLVCRAQHAFVCGRSTCWQPQVNVVTANGSSMDVAVAFSKAAGGGFVGRCQRVDG